jgi:hypothetical protein
MPLLRTNGLTRLVAFLALVVLAISVTDGLRTVAKGSPSSAYTATHSYDRAAAAAMPSTNPRGERGAARVSWLSTSRSGRFVAAEAGGALRRFGHKLADETGSLSLPRLGRAPEFEGGRVTESGALDAASRWLGKGYREVSPGRFVSAKGDRQVRYGAHEVRSRVHHIHFEALENGRVVENTRAVILP